MGVPVISPTDPEKGLRLHLRLVRERLDALIEMLARRVSALGAGDLIGLLLADPKLALCLGVVAIDRRGLRSRVGAAVADDDRDE